MPFLLANLRQFYAEVFSAIGDFHFYRTVISQNWGRTLIYLLYLAAHVALVLSLTYALLYSGELRRFSEWAQSEIPPLQVKDGELTVRAEQPLLRRYQGKHQIMFVFDTTGEYSSPDGFQQPALLLTKTSLMFRYQGQTESHEWREFGSFRVDSEQVRTWERVIRWSYFPVSYSLLLIYNLVAKSLTAVFLTGFAVIAATRHGVRLPFRSSFAVALYSLTPAIVIGLGVNLTGLYISYFYAIYLIIAAIYTYMATLRSVAPAE
jgi:hypothetical protein